MSEIHDRHAAHEMLGIRGEIGNPGIDHAARTLGQLGKAGTTTRFPWSFEDEPVARNATAHPPSSIAESPAFVFPEWRAAVIDLAQADTIVRSGRRVCDQPQIISL